MPTYFRSLVLFLIIVAAIAVPNISLADCATVSGGVNSNGDGFIGGSIGLGDNVSCGGGIGGMFGRWGLANPFGLPSGSIYLIVATIINWLLALFGFLGILGFLISGTFYLISAGNDEMAKQAKAGLKYSIIGIIVGLSGYVVMQAIAGLLSGVAGQY